MKYLPVFTLRVTHSYYADGRCPDFSMEPNPGTEKLLKNHRCVLKSLPDGVRVLMQVDTQGMPFIACPEKMTFTFNLRLQNRDFALFTDLSEITQQPAPLYTTVLIDSKPGKELKLASREAWYEEKFIVQHPAQNDCFVLSSQPLEGLATNDFEIMDSGNIKLESYNRARKVITVNTESAPKDSAFVVKYPIVPRLERGVFADVEIRNTGTLQPAKEGSAEFEIAFTARKARWKYYLVTDLKNTEKKFEIKHGKLKFSANRVDITEEPDSSDDLAKELVRKYAKMQVHRFLSDDDILCRQTARKNLELHFDGNCLFKALPNPPLRNHFRTKVKVGDDLQLQEAFSQVVKYITNPNP